MRTTALALLVFVLADPAAAQQSPRSSEPGGAAWTFAWRDHPTVELGPARIELRMQGLADRRASDAPLDDSDTSRFDTARRRVGIAGAIGKAVEFQIERELSGGGWKDVFVNLRALGPVELQGGNFKMPFGLDENTSSSNLDFVYRSRAATELAPGRNVGVMAHGRAGIVKYEAGVFREQMRAGRVVVQPLRKQKSLFEDVQAGVAYAVSPIAEGVSDLRGDTALGRRFFPSFYEVNGLRHRLGFETRWRPGPFSVQSEIVRVLDERRGQSTRGTDLAPLAATAWYVQGSWIATGERKTKGADRPRNPLFDGGIGSIELAARLERLRFGSDASGDAALAPRAEAVARHQDTAMTFGLNWSPNRWIRLQANLVREHVIVPEGAAWTSPSVFWSRVLRIRFAL